MKYILSSHDGRNGQNGPNILALKDKYPNFEVGLK